MLSESQEFSQSINERDDAFSGKIVSSEEPENEFEQSEEVKTEEDMFLESCDFRSLDFDPNQHLKEQMDEKRRQLMT